MPGPSTRAAAAIRPALVRYAVAWAFLVGVCAAEIAYSLLPPRDQAAVLAWASTNVHNLTRDPVGCMIASAFFPAASLLVWPLIIAATMLGANGALGNWRTAVTCAAGHVIGTLVSEGILWYRIDHGTRPAADRLIQDVGPSYVVVTAIAVALLWGSWLARLSAALAFAGLIFIGGIFSGLSHLELTPVGHVTALVVGVTVGSYLAWDRRRRPAAAGLRSA
jgi:hypothetical protein